MPPLRELHYMRGWIVVAMLACGSSGYAYWVKPWETKPVAVAMETVSPGPGSEVLATIGEIVPGQSVDLGTLVGGQIRTVDVNEGDIVNKGQFLAQLDDKIPRAALSQARSALDAAQVSEAEAESAWKRAKALGATISQQSRDSAKFAFDGAVAKVEQLQAAYEQARHTVEQYRITSPISGTVLRIDADPGEVIGASASLFSIGDMAAPRIETDIDEQFGSRLKVGLSARVAPVGADAPMPAHVTSVAPRINADTGGRTVRLAFDAPPKSPLPSGLTVSVNIVVDTFEKAIAAPRVAIKDLQKSPYVLVEANGFAEKRRIEVREWPSDRLIVTKGLEEGDRLIVDPANIAPGTPVIGNMTSGGQGT